MGKTIYLAAILTGLCACGGGGGGSSDVTAPPAPPTTTTPSVSAARALLDEYADPVTYTNISTVPTTGSATYTGYAYGTLSNTGDQITNSLIGALELSVGFNAGTSNFSGRIDSFVDDNGNTLSGSLTFSGGAFDRAGNPTSDPTIGVTVSGDLTDTQSRTLSLTGQLEGDFLGSNHVAIGGEFLGSVTVNGQAQDIDGGFIGER